MNNEDFRNLAETNAAYANIVTRTSIRRYSEREVANSLKEAICFAGMSAPSGVNRQPWELIIVDDKDILRKLAESLPYAKMAATAPFAIIVCGNRDRFLDGDDSTLWEQDLSAVSENILLASHALGLGGVWTALYPHTDREKAVSDILNLPDSFVAFNVIPIGYPESEHKPMDKWHPDRVHHNGF